MADQYSSNNGSALCDSESSPSVHVWDLSSNEDILYAYEMAPISKLSLKKQQEQSETSSRDIKKGEEGKPSLSGKSSPIFSKSAKLAMDMTLGLPTIGPIQSLSVSADGTLLAALSRNVKMSPSTSLLNFISIYFQGLASDLVHSSKRCSNGTRRARSFLSTQEKFTCSCFHFQ